MKTEMFVDELLLGMDSQLKKQASTEVPDLNHAAECLHSALEILEEQGLDKQAEQLLSLLEKIGTTNLPVKKASPITSIKQLMDAGVSQRDLQEFTRGVPRAIAKLTLVLYKLGLSKHEIGKFLKLDRVMSEQEAHKMLSPNEPGSILEFTSLKPEGDATEPEDEFLTFKSLASKKKFKIPQPNRDPHTKGLTPAKMVENIKEHGHPLNLANDCAIEVPSPPHKDNLTKDDMDSDFADLLNSNTFDIDASDDDLLNANIKDDDSLEVIDKDIMLEDFEDEH